MISSVSRSGIFELVEDERRKEKKKRRLKLESVVFETLDQICGDFPGAGAVGPIVAATGSWQTNVPRFPFTRGG